MLLSKTGIPGGRVGLETMLRRVQLLVNVEVQQNAGVCTCSMRFVGLGFQIQGQLTEG